MTQVALVDDWRNGYPAFGWVDAMNEAGTIYGANAVGIWYLPAINEIAELYQVYDNNADFNEGLGALPAVPLSPDYYWSSTESIEGTVERSPSANIFSLYDGGENFAPKTAELIVRAVLAF